MDNGVSFTLGKYGSVLGFEREDPTGLYTFSRAYSLVDSDNDGNRDNDSLTLVMLIQMPLKVSLSHMLVTHSVSLLPLKMELMVVADTDIEVDELNLELSFAYTGIENVTIGVVISSITELLTLMKSMH